MRRAVWLIFLGSVVVLGGACSGSDDKGKTPQTGPNVPQIPQSDRSRCDAKGKRVVELDLNKDKTPDVWKMYASVTEKGAKVDLLTCKEIDLNFDGRKDVWVYYNADGERKMEEMDLDFDGKIDLTTIRQGGKKVRQDLDTNFDGKPDIWKYFEDEVLTKLHRDTNWDGKVDHIEYYEGGKLDRVGYDKDGDGRVDTWDRAGKTAQPAAGTAAATTTPAPEKK